jgi:hypothetical protein
MGLGSNPAWVDARAELSFLHRLACVPIRFMADAIRNFDGETSLHRLVIGSGDQKQLCDRLDFYFSGKFETSKLPRAGAGRQGQR